MKLSKKEQQNITDYIVTREDEYDYDDDLDEMLRALDDPVGKADIAYRDRHNVDIGYTPKMITLRVSDCDLGAILKALRYTHHSTHNTDIGMYDAYWNIVKQLRGEEQNDADK